MTIKEIREKFINYYQELEYILVPPSSLINDEEFPGTFLPSLGVTTIDKILNSDSESNAYSLVQNCFREIDMKNIGNGIHLLFFETVCTFAKNRNFALKIFTDYISFIKEMGIRVENLSATFFDGGTISNDYIQKDEIGPELLKQVGLKSDALIRCQNKDGVIFSKDRQRGGYRLEIFYNYNGRHIEISTLFLICLEKRGNHYNFLPENDWITISATGLERLALILGDLTTIHDIEILSSIKEKITKITNVDDYTKLNIISEYIRGFPFLVATGEKPGSHGRRRIMRKIVRIMLKELNNLQINDFALLIPVFETVINYYSDFYKDLTTKKEEIINKCYNILLNEKVLLGNGNEESR